MTGNIFIDSNIWLYLFLNDEANKFEIAERYMRENSNKSIFISYQVINEVTNQLVRNNFSEIIIRENIDYMYKICTVHNFSKDIIMLALSLRGKFAFSFWDSIIVASALNSGCDILATEDMHDGLRIENTTIRNIFRETK